MKYYRWITAIILVLVIITCAVHYMSRVHHEDASIKYRKTRSEMTKIIKELACRDDHVELYDKIIANKNEFNRIANMRRQRVDVYIYKNEWALDFPQVSCFVIGRSDLAMAYLGEDMKKEYISRERVLTHGRIIVFGGSRVSGTVTNDTKIVPHH